MKDMEVAKTKAAALKEQKTEDKMKKEKQKVAKLQSQHEREAKRAVPAAMKSLSDEVRVHTKLSAALTALSKRANKGEQAQAKLNSEASTIRRMAEDNKNQAEQELDTLSRNIQKEDDHMDELGEAESVEGDQLSSAKAGLKAYKRLLVNQKNNVQAIVNGAKKVSLSASRIQEMQRLAADESSRVDVDAKVLSARLGESDDNVNRLERKAPSASALHRELQHLGIQDRQQYHDLSKLNDEAVDALSNEDAGVKETKAEMNSEDAVLGTVAADLMPSA